MLVRTNTAPGAFRRRVTSHASDPKPSETGYPRSRAARFLDIDTHHLDPVSLLIESTTQELRDVPQVVVRPPEEGFPSPGIWIRQKRGIDRGERVAPHREQVAVDSLEILSCPVLLEGNEQQQHGQRSEERQSDLKPKQPALSGVPLTGPERGTLRCRSRKHVSKCVRPERRDASGRQAACIARDQGMLSLILTPEVAIGSRRSRPAQRAMADSSAAVAASGTSYRKMLPPSTAIGSRSSNTRYRSPMGTPTEIPCR